MAGEQRFEIESFAKLNLSLIVYRARRTDGYHPICSVFQTISLADILEIQLLKSRELVLTCTNPTLPTNEQNILSKVYRHYAESIPFGMKIMLKKNIPMGGGLGGGSSNAAALLNFLNQRAGWKWSTGKLQQEGLRFGADIPFFIKGGSALVRGIGEKISPLRPKNLGCFLLINPNEHMETRVLYGDLDSSGTLRRAGRTPNWVQKNRVGENTFREAVFKRSRKLSAIAEYLESQLNKPLYLSGSGATTFAVLPTELDAGQLAKALLKKFDDITVWVATAVDKGSTGW